MLPAQHRLLFGRAMDTDVGDIAKPGPNFAVGRRDVNEHGLYARHERYEERLAHVAVEPLHLPLGLRAVRMAELGANPVVPGKIEKRRIEAVLAIAVLLMLRAVSKSWTATWVGQGGRALTPSVGLDSMAAD